MAKNNRDIDRAVKVEAIELAATTLFTEQGYESTSMAKVAQHAGVATNTLYWYYKNKDEILVSVLNRLVNEGLTGFSLVATEPLNKQIMWLLNKLGQVNTLISTVHSKVEHSAEIRKWHDQFHLILDQFLISQLLTRGIDKKQASLEAAIVTFVVEGLLSHSYPKQQQELIVNLLIKEHLGNA